jgi:hypothetical protein
MKKLFVSTISGFLTFSGLLLLNPSQSVAINTKDIFGVVLPIEIPDCPLTLTPDGFVTHVCPGEPIPSEPLPEAIDCPLTLTPDGYVTHICPGETTPEPYPSKGSHQDLF